MVLYLIWYSSALMTCHEESPRNRLVKTPRHVTLRTHAPSIVYCVHLIAYGWPFCAHHDGALIALVASFETS